MRFEKQLKFLNMDRRLKIITIALSMVYLLCIGAEIYRGLAAFASGFKFGLEEGLNYRETGEMPSLSTAGFYLSMKPENGFRSFPTIFRNQLDNKPMKAEIEKMAVQLSDVKDKLPKGAFVAEMFSYMLALFALFVMVMIPVQTFRVVRSITMNKIFDPANIQKLRIIGYALLVYYAAELIFNLIHYRIAASVIQVDGYSLQVDRGNITFVLLGFVVLMFAEVLKVSVHLKEEQDLTV